MQSLQERYTMKSVQDLFIREELGSGLVGDTFVKVPRPAYDLLPGETALVLSPEGNSILAIDKGPVEVPLFRMLEGNSDSRRLFIQECMLALIESALEQQSLPALPVSLNEAEDYFRVVFGLKTAASVKQEIQLWSTLPSREDTSWVIGVLGYAGIHVVVDPDKPDACSHGLVVFCSRIRATMVVGLPTVLPIPVARSCV
jgi:hypothetical protein